MTRLHLRCRSCGDLRPLVVTALSGAVAGLMAQAVGLGPTLPAYLWFGAMTVVLLVTDLDHKRIPNRITYPATPLAALLLAAGAVAEGQPAALGRGALGALAYATGLFVVFLIARGGFGFGDVKLAVPIGLFTAYPSWGHLWVAVFVTAGVGGLVAVAALVSGRAKKGTEIPYGPPMIVGAWTALAAGPTLGAALF